MNINIFGNKAFKSEIHKVLDHSNIKFHLEDGELINDINTLIELRTSIQNNPEDVFLIDDAKIFRKNVLNEKIKFLKPRGAIEEEFLKEYGVDDIKVDSINDIPKFIINKLQNIEGRNQNDDDYFDRKDNSDIQESIIGIVNDAYDKSDESFEEEILTEKKDEVLDEPSTVDEIDEDDFEALDDELSSLFSSNEDYDAPLNTDIEEQPLENFEENSIDDLDLLDTKNSEDDVESIVIQGENMADEFSEFDLLNENDILAALEGLDSVDVNSIVPQKTVTSAQTAPASSISNNNSVNLSSENAGELVSMLSQLLNNKTLEITIKIKD